MDFYISSGQYFFACYNQKMSAAHIRIGKNLIQQKNRIGETVKMWVLIGIFSIAVYSDLRSYRIPNLCIIAGVSAGLIMTGMSYSMAGVFESLADMFLIFIAFYPFYLLGGIGAGDVKLFMMTGCYIRGMELFQYMFVTMAIAAVCSMVKITVFAESRERMFYLGRYIRKIVYTRAVDTYEIDKTQKRSVIRLSVPAFLSLLLYQTNMLH